jgi:hypothetical protein
LIFFVKECGCNGTGEGRGGDMFYKIFFPPTQWIKTNIRERPRSWGYINEPNYIANKTLFSKEVGIEENEETKGPN